MSDYVQDRAPSPSRECAEARGYPYSACFYPGFVRRLAVRKDGQEILLYEQEKGHPFVLPAGADEPWTCSQIEFRRDPDGPPLSLTIDDPRREVARIEVYFKSGTETGDGEDDGESLVVWETPVVCPPFC